MTERQKDRMTERQKEEKERKKVKQGVRDAHFMVIFDWVVLC